MPDENRERVAGAAAAINETYRTGDMGPWRQYVEDACDPEIVLEAPTDAFTEGEWRGHDGAVGFVENQMEVLEGMWLRVEELIEVDSEGYVVAITFGGRARYSGLEVEMHPFHTFRLRDGKVIHWQIFVRRDQALEAASAR